METIENIVREMREFADKDSQTIGRDVLRREIQHFADRIKVAVAKSATTTPTCKKSLQVGDTAQIREALVKLVEVIDKYDGSSPLWWHSGAKGVIPLKNAKDALAKPPRNCDKFPTPKDAMLAHLEEVYDGEKVEFGDYEWCEFVKWLLAEAKGETND